MDHVVYLDTRANELENLLTGKKTMILRGAAGRKLPHGRVKRGDILYFMRNNGEGLVKARALVKSVFHSDQLSPDESRKIVHDNQPRLQLNESLLNRFAGKRFLVLVEVEDIEPLDAFAIDRDRFSNMDDWLPVGQIDTVITV